MSIEAESRAIVEAGLQELGLEVPASHIDQLIGLAALLSQWAPRINLTGHRSQDAIARRLILEAAALLSALPISDSGKALESIADLGSGAGFPGLPLAILLPRTRVVLVEARERRHHFQRAAVRRLGLANAQPLRGRIEVLEPQPCAVAIAQAVGPADRVLGWMVDWVLAGGLLVIPGSETPARPAPDPRVSDVQVVTYRAPGGPPRTLWCARRL